jgi:hypothetical protein
VVRDNSSDYTGGGIRCQFGGTVSNCVVSGNSVDGYSGGGLYLYQGGTVENCRIEYNTASTHGGGVRSYGGTIRDSTIQHNAASADYGGGIFGYYGTLIYNCNVVSNSAGWGGGVFLLASSEMHNSVVAYNVAEVEGGGVYFHDGGLVNNCTVAANAAATYGSGLFCNNCGAIRNSVVWGNEGFDITGTPTTNEYNCLREWNGPGTAVTTADPLYASPAAGNYRLSESSGCRNSGNNGFACGSVDLDGNPRIADTIIDRGAYELIASGLDADGDSLPDWWEWTYARSRTGLVASEDDDGDGLHNDEELLAGSDPTSASSVFDLASLPAQGATGNMVRWPSVVNREYELFYGTNLFRAFSLLATNVAATPPVNTYTDAVHGAVGSIYYRVKVRPAD